ncbi:MAG: YqeG family HAD IIIA-type phosphatase [Clostridia bacterium]|nr:YqeG family HAD IIIA-type phosphatase [Clostridia bacterium]
MSSIFLPDIFAETVFDINLEELKKEGIKAFIFDIDNTLATYAMPVADEKTAIWLKNLQDMGFGVFIVSNNNRERVRIFAEDAGVPYFGKALKPLSFFLRRACRKMGVKPSETALVGDQLFTDIWGGSLLRMKTILVKPISDVEDGFVKFKRRFERRILAKMKK